MQLTFGERLTILRRRRKLTAAQLAAQIQCAPNDIYRMENGQIRNPGIERVAKLAMALDVAIEVLWTGTSAPPE